MAECLIKRGPPVALASGQIVRVYLCSQPECGAVASWRLESERGFSYWCFDGGHLPEQAVSGNGKAPALMLITGLACAYELERSDG